MARNDWRDLVLYIAEEGDVTDCRLALGCELLARVESPFVTTVPKKKGSTLMERWKDDHERAKHLFALRSIEARLEERPFTWEAT